jgi:hypothetical protein
MLLAYFLEPPPMYGYHTRQILIWTCILGGLRWTRSISFRIDILSTIIQWTLHTWLFTFNFNLLSPSESLTSPVTQSLISSYFSFQFFLKISPLPISFGHLDSICPKINDIFDFIYVYKCTTLITDIFNYLLLKIMKIVYFENTRRDKSKSHMLIFSCIY